MNEYGKAMALYGAWQNGHLEAEGLEAKARMHAGYDGGSPEPLTAAEREYMANDAHSCDPAYPYEEGIALDDHYLSLWWLLAMRSYVDDLFG